MGHLKSCFIKIVYTVHFNRSQIFWSKFEEYYIMDLIALAYVLTLNLYCVRGTSSQPPNIVIMVADDLGIGDIGCFGNGTIKTPNIDGIADEGVKLTHHLSAATVCTPSRAALLTGRYPIRSGMASHNNVRVHFFLASSGGLTQNETTFAELAKRQGYNTAIMGKWHLGLNCEQNGDYCHHPSKHGFDRFYGLSLSNHKGFGDDSQSLISFMFPRFYDVIGTLIFCGIFSCYFLTSKLPIRLLMFVLFAMAPAILALVIYNISTLNGVVHRDFEVVEQPVALPGFTQRLVNESKVFMEEQVSNKKPFLLLLSFLHVHDAMFTAEEFKGHSEHSDYGDNIEEMDWAVGEIKKSIAEMGQRHNTFVYLTSDHGGHLENLAPDGSRIGGHNGRYRGGKMMGGMEGGIRVPAVAMYPNVIPEGSEVSEPTSLMDVFPTILGLTGHPLVTDRPIDGKDMMPLMNKSVKHSEHEFLFHYCGVEIHAARLNDRQDNSVWKVHYATPRWLPGTERCEFLCQCDAENANYHNPPLMYELNSDPYESNPIDIKSDVKYVKVLERIKEAMDEHKRSLVAVQSQFSLSHVVWKPWLQPCCNFPFCQCSDPVYQTHQ